MFSSNSVQSDLMTTSCQCMCGVCSFGIYGLVSPSSNFDEIELLLFFKCRKTCHEKRIMLHSNAVVFIIIMCSWPLF